MMSSSLNLYCINVPIINVLRQYKFVFILLWCVCACAHTPRCTFRGQRTALWCWFSPFTFLWIPGLWPRAQVFRPGLQAPLPFKSLHHFLSPVMEFSFYFCFSLLKTESLSIALDILDKLSRFDEYFKVSQFYFLISIINRQIYTKTERFGSHQFQQYTPVFFCFSVF